MTQRRHIYRTYDDWKLATPPEYEEDEDEQEYEESAEYEYQDRDPEHEDMKDDDWDYWLEVVGT